MRGKPQFRPLYVQVARITPADAGKTEIGAETYGLFKDHPRGCGENGVVAFFIGLYLGSPPRMRGKPEMKERIEYDDRITPADAGKTM